MEPAEIQKVEELPIADASPTYNFHPLAAKFVAAEEKESRKLLEKWGLLSHTQFFKFRYDELVRKYDLPRFLTAFFASPDVRQHFQVLTRSGSWSHTGGSKVDKVEMEELRCGQLSMEFFDRLTSAGVVRQSGYIMKCMEDEYDGVLCPDELHMVFMNEDSEHYSIYNDDDRKELLFGILRQLVLGGGVNQYEDIMQPYLDVTKTIYKDMVVVQKIPATGKLEVASYAAKILSVDGYALWPNDHPANFCYVAVDPIKRHVNVWYGAHISVW
eukprot:TRINITY_DN13868_c0_g1_i1.p1 TRINITY_DN13868_c0_g1~~TRINITY_DN13868_c0_g1_i1.p1  ORF type:complete len:271 (-),score=50.11 TRINITY_DN13868_c0_g1_i1:8-820(-)